MHRCPNAQATKIGDVCSSNRHSEKCYPLVVLVVMDTPRSLLKYTSVLGVI